MSRSLIALFWLAASSWSLAAIEVTDATGATVKLPVAAQRIISLAPNITELLFAIGAGKHVIGADEYSNYPEPARQITRVSNYAAANYELILSLQPDLVIAWQSGNGQQIVERIRQLGIPLFVIEPRRLDDIPRVMHQLGQLTGETSAADKQASGFRERLRTLRNRYRDATPVTVFYQIWNQPLITINGKHLISDVLRVCGGKNVFSDALPLVPYTSIEAIVQADPQLIIASGSSEDSPSWLKMWQNWSQISAVRNGHVYYVPPDLMQRHSARILDGAEQVCVLLEKERRRREP